MENLIDGIEKVSKEEIVQQLAEFEVYTLRKTVSIIFNKIVNTAKHILKKQVDRNKNTDSFKCNYDLTLNGLLHLTNQEIRERIRKQLTKKVYIAAMIRIRNEKSSDELSAAVTKSVIPLLNKSKIKGFAISEINDYVFHNYNASQTGSSRVRLQLWAILSFFFFVIYLVIIIANNFSIKYSLLLYLIILLIFTGYTARKNAQKQLIHFLWLAASGLETGSIKNRSIMFEQLISNEAHDKLTGIFRAVHTLNNSCVHIKQEKEKIEKNITEAQSTIRTNQDIISKAGSDSEDMRFIQNKQKENSRLTNVISEWQNQCKQKEAQFNKVKNLAISFEQLAYKQIMQIWSEAFQDMSFQQDMVLQFIRNFSFKDMEQVEQRMYELHSTDAPLALAKTKGGISTVTFHTVQDDIGSLKFRLENKTINFCGITRENELLEPPLTQEELNKLMGNTSFINKELDEVRQQLAIRQEQWEKERQKLQKQASDLDKRVNTAMHNLVKKQEEVEKLSISIYQRKCECDELQSKIRQMEASDDKNNERYQSLEKEYRRQQDELVLYQKREKELNNDLQNAYSEMNSYIVQKEKLQKSMDKLKEDYQRELQKLKSDFEKKIQEKTDKIDEQQSQINLLNTLIGKSEKEKKADKKTLEKLTKVKENLEKSNHRLTKEREELLSENNSIEQKYQKKLEEVKDQYDKKFYEPLYDEQIYERMYKMILSSKNCVYIVAPYVKDHKIFSPFQKNKEIFLRAHRMNPGLRFRILYGIQDKDRNGKLLDSNQLEKSKSVIAQYQKLLGNSLQAELTNTHTKLVIVDDTCFLLGSANVLSFSGDYTSGDVHHEIMLYSTDKEVLMELKNHHFS